MTRRSLLKRLRYKGNINFLWDDDGRRIVLRNRQDLRSWSVLCHLRYRGHAVGGGFTIPRRLPTANLSSARADSDKNSRLAVPLKHHDMDLSTACTDESCSTISSEFEEGTQNKASNDTHQSDGNSTQAPCQFRRFGVQWPHREHILWWRVLINWQMVCRQSLQNCRGGPVMCKSFRRVLHKRSRHRYGVGHFNEDQYPCS